MVVALAATNGTQLSSRHFGRLSCISETFMQQFRHTPQVFHRVLSQMSTVDRNLWTERHAMLVKGLPEPRGIVKSGQRKRWKSLSTLRMVDPDPIWSEIFAGQASYSWIYRAALLPDQWARVQKLCRWLSGHGLPFLASWVGAALVRFADAFDKCGSI